MALLRLQHLGVHHRYQNIGTVAFRPFLAVPKMLCISVLKWRGIDAGGGDTPLEFEGLYKGTLTNITRSLNKVLTIYLVFLHAVD